MGSHDDHIGIDRLGGTDNLLGGLTDGGVANDSSDGDTCLFKDGNLLGEELVNLLGLLEQARPRSALKATPTPFVCGNRGIRTLLAAASSPAERR
jgi:hypothetical protein